MLARLAATLGQRHTLGAGNPATTVDVGEGATLVVDENCTVSFVGRFIRRLLTLHFRLCEYSATYIIHITSPSKLLRIRP